MKNAENAFKTFGNLFIVITVITAFSSCSDFSNIEKRHYRSGYYVPKNKISVRTETNKIAHANTLTETKAPEEVKFIPENSLKQNFIPVTTVKTNTVTVKSKSIKKQFIAANIIAAPAVPEKAKTDDKHPKRQEGKTLGIISGTLFILGILTIPIGIGSLMVFAALIMGIIAIVLFFGKSRNVKTANENNQSSKLDNDQAPQLSKNYVLQTIWKTVLITIVAALLLMAGLFVWFLFSWQE